MFSVTSVVLSAEEYTIQTISAQKEASITPAFEKKVHKSVLPSTKKKEGKCNIVTVGKYPSAASAYHDLKKAKAISKDAFVRPINRTTPKACESATAEKKAADAHTPVASVKKEVSISTAHETASSPSASSAVVTRVAVAPNVQEAKAEPCKAQPCEKVTNTDYVYDRNIGRKSDKHDAKEYYKNSPNQTLKPMLTHR
ncbi:MAG: hypothetical protein Q8M43_06530 [Sulfuricurvum sp.]|uniref:hypothetical protein n=1 Tax=Sulfuricurvum sp. TaxID=2025608 RepID=UPI0027370C5B|nr:hypothetical protein [Sulfuricurvum sp.]MDP3291669.1 hypothetical protein [Sulfuricurvum sp.]